MVFKKKVELKVKAKWVAPKWDKKPFVPFWLAKKWSTEKKWGKVEVAAKKTSFAGKE